MHKLFLCYNNRLVYSTEYLEMYEVHSINHQVNKKIEKDKNLDKIWK